MLSPAIRRSLPIFRGYDGLFAETPGQLEQVHGREAATAWRLFCFNWLFLAAAIVVFGVSLLLTNFHIHPAGYLVLLAASALYGLSGYFNARSPEKSRPWIFSLLTTIAQAIVALGILASLTYVATAANLPLQDQALLAIDRALGLDFRSFLNLVNNHAWLRWAIAAGYSSIGWPMAIVVVGLPLAGHHLHAAKFILAFSLALSVTICITMLVPAIGTYQAIGIELSDFPDIIPGGYLDTLREMPALRAGTSRVLDVRHLAGVVTFPSFHAAGAILYIWGLWPWRWLRPINLVVNGAMLVSAPIGGGHFFVDVLAGIAVAAAAIVAANQAARLLARGIGRRGSIADYRYGAVAPVS